MVKINEAGCAGCGLCASLCPQGFEMVDRIAKVRDASVDCIKSAASACPRDVIILDDAENISQSNQLGISQGRSMGGGRGMGSGQGTGRGRGMGRNQGSGKGRGRM